MHDHDQGIAATRSRKPLRLAALMVAFACLTVAITVWLQLTLVHHFAQEHASKEASLRLEQLSWQMRDALNRTLEGAVRDVHLLSVLSEIRSAKDPQQARHVLDNLQHNYPDYAWIGIATPEGKVLAATGGLLEGRDVTARSWFHRAQQGIVAEDYHPAVMLGNLLPRTPDPWRFVDVAGPILGDDGSLRGVLGLHLSWRWARSLARELLTPAVRAYGAEIIVVRSDGVVLLGPDDLLEQRIATSSLRLAQQEHSGAVTERWPDGHVYVTGYSQTGRAHSRSTLRWSVLVRQTEATAMASTRDFERRALWLSIALGTLLAGCAALLTRRIVAPLKTLSSVIETFSRAPTKARADAIPQVTRFHEAQVLSNALRELIRGERTHQDALERMNAQLEDTVAARTAELQDMLMRDTLTGLPNRRALMQALPEMMAHAARLERPCAVMFLDLDGFKAINDTRGHEAGDELLCQFGTRLVNGIRETDMAVRLAGDEFIVVLDMINSSDEAETKAQFLLATLARPFVLRSGVVQVGVSIGVAIHQPQAQPDPARLLARADQAMYEAKRRGKGQVALDATVQARAVRDGALLS
jgi:diguanylate cyclase (GGDEF)-like protein